MRIVLYIVILSALFFAPLQRMEIANLEPIQAVWMYREDGDVVLETDTDDKGRGVTVVDALNDMKNNSPGIVYLDTAQYLFVSEIDKKEIYAIMPYLKKTVRLCIWDGQADIESAIKYADSHKTCLKMKQWHKVGNLPELPPLKKDK